MRERCIDIKIILHENIRDLRRKAGYTQQQLADAMGVTVGAVSKWESGQSSPDISLLAEIADFFEVSVDILLGYQWKKTSMGEMCEQIKRFTREKNVRDGVSVVRKALQKYPNSFDVVYYSAKFFRLNGMEKTDKALVREGLELYQKALLLVDYNEDEEITPTSLKNNIADSYILLGEIDKAVDYLKKNNSDGVNNGMIGFILSQTGKAEEALNYLSDSFVDTYAELFRTCLGLSNCYVDIGKVSESICINEWLLKLMQGLKIPGKIGYIDKTDVMICVSLARLYLMDGKTERAEEYLKRAKDIAAEFDAAPDCCVNTIRFTYNGVRVLFDDFGPTAFEGIEKNLLIANDEKLNTMWERIKNENK